MLTIRVRIARVLDVMSLTRVADLTPQQRHEGGLRTTAQTTEARIARSWLVVGLPG